MLAALQELDKLSLRFGEAPITLEMMESDISDSAHYDVFSLNDALLKGDAVASLRIVNTLQQEGTAHLAILGALARDMLSLATASEAIAAGVSLQAAIQQMNVWPKHRAPLFQSALRRMNATRTRHLFKHLCRIDLAAKGMDAQDPWLLLQELCLLLCQPTH